MKLIGLSVTWFPSLARLALATTDPLSYQNIPGYVIPKSSDVTTALDFIKSRPDLKFTFFAPNNDAFENHVGAYFNTFEGSPKGKWWLGNTILHHYVPNSELTSASFNETYQRFQTATFLFVGSQTVDGIPVLNQVATAVESDILVTSGVVHIIDRILDPSAQIFESDLPRISQKFIAGSCSNPDLPYC
ncbi:hypothetical protein BJX99DRAFT_250269 [Aspergillus californicus]